VHLILINGKPGTGKTTISKALLPLLPEPSAWIDTDDLMHVQPFVGAAVCADAIERAALLCKDFQTRGYAHVIISGCAHSTELLKRMSEFNGTFVQLTSHGKISHARKTSQGYAPEKNPTMFGVIASEETPLSASDVAPFQWVMIDTSAQAPEKIAEDICRSILGQNG
jgi:CO dehydrogenase nickel-insertion accessory protein CooC1